MEPPLWATRSASIYPGAGSFQSANVRVGILRRSSLAMPLFLLTPLALSRTLLSKQSIDAALTARMDCFTSASSCKWPCWVCQLELGSPASSVQEK